MRRTMIGMTLITLLVTPVLAQNPPAQSEPGNRAINSRDQNNANNPVAGANSFTEGQAKEALINAKMRSFAVQADVFLVKSR
jgi:hypothetical protein